MRFSEVYVELNGIPLTGVRHVTFGRHEPPRCTPNRRARLRRWTARCLRAERAARHRRLMSEVRAKLSTVSVELERRAAEFEALGCLADAVFGPLLGRWS